MNRPEITCTKKQKATIIDALCSPQGCLWRRRMATCWMYDRDCRDCFEKNIKWNIIGNARKEQAND